MNKIKIEIQYFHGCPHSSDLIRNVNNAIAGIEENIELSEILVEDNREAAKIGFRGSPTLLINGKDFEGMPEPDNPGMTCRFYHNGVPTKERIRKKILENLL